MNCPEIEGIIGALRSSGVARSEEWEGCSEHEIQQLESRFGVQLPICYQRFLQILGKNPGEFMQGTDFAFTDLFHMRGDAEDLLNECNTEFNLPTNAFVIMFHGGYNFAFLQCDGSENPQVFRYEECDDKPVLVAESFTDWLANLVGGFIQITTELPPVES